MNDDELFKLLNPDEEPPKKEQINWDLIEKVEKDKIKIDKDKKYDLNFNFINNDRI